MIAVDAVSFRYRAATDAVLDGFSASFPSGAVTAVCGPNGCGKTTLVKLLVGIERPQAGRVLIDDTDIRPLSLAEIGRRVGCVYQNPSRQLFCTSVREEMAYGLRAQGLSDDQIAACSERYLELFGLTRHGDDFPLHLSRGEQQRLMLAVILAMGPSYVVLDEPTTGLDLARRRALGTELRQLAEHLSRGVVVITHEHSFVARYADVELIMDGQP